MRCVVTGASGFSGTALCARLRAERHEVTALSSRNCGLAQAGALEQFGGVACVRRGLEETSRWFYETAASR